MLNMSPSGNAMPVEFGPKLAKLRSDWAKFCADLRKKGNVFSDEEAEAIFSRALQSKTPVYAFGAAKNIVRAQSCPSAFLKNDVSVPASARTSPFSRQA